MVELRHYKHYKGGIYRVIAIATDEQTMEKVVVYQSVDTAKIWVRKQTDFLATVDVDGKSVLRFSPIDFKE